MLSRNIVELMRVPPADHDIKWLQEALGNAVQLELATLPPYLCAYWSIKDSNADVARMILSICKQEMVHMGFVANMLVGIGGATHIDSAVPKYPGPLPGGVNKDLTVYLEGLTPSFIRDVCMQIEMPEEPLARASLDEYPTIGGFYDAIAGAFDDLKPDISPKYQQTSWVSTGVSVIKDYKEAIAAINDVIKVQGEGTDVSPDEADGEPAHYYLFGSMYHGHALIQDQQTKEWVWQGKVVPWPEVWPVARIPAGGWIGQETTPADVKKKLENFNAKYKEMLATLQAAWSGTGNADDAWPAMQELTELASGLVATSIGDGANGNYGPDFVVVTEDGAEDEPGRADRVQRESPLHGEKVAG